LMIMPGMFGWTMAAGKEIPPPDFRLIEGADRLLAPGGVQSKIPQSRIEN
jgi:hypothetical protein